MKIPSLRELDDIRKTGFRPQVVVCFLHDKEVLFLYDKKYDLWQFPQGGVDNGESIEKAVSREMKEELGGDFAVNIKEVDLIGENEIKFPPDKWGSRNLKTDDEEEILMKGKKYFFVAMNVDSRDLDINQTEFDGHKWLNYEESLRLTEKIYQKGKRRVTEDALNRLHALNFI